MRHGRQCTIREALSAKLPRRTSQSQATWFRRQWRRRKKPDRFAAVRKSAATIPARVVQSTRQRANGRNTNNVAGRTAEWAWHGWFNFAVVRDWSADLKDECLWSRFGRLLRPHSDGVNDDFNSDRSFF